MYRCLMVGLMSATVMSCSGPSESPVQTPASPSATGASPSWSDCPVTREDVKAATGMDTGKAHFRERSSSHPAARCTFTVGSSGLVELHDAVDVTASNYLTEIANSLLPPGTRADWQDAPALGPSGKTACGVFKDPLLKSCIAVALHGDTRAIVVMVSTGPSKNDLERTAAAVTLAKKSLGQ